MHSRTSSIFYRPSNSNTKIINLLFRLKPAPTSQQQKQTLTRTQNPLPEITLILLKCKNINHLKQLHALLTTKGLIRYPPIASKLITSFASSTSPEALTFARSVAYRIKGLDTYTWNSIIRGYLEKHDPKNAILVYNHVRRIGLEVDSYTLLYVVKACGLIPVICSGKQIHAQIQKLGLGSQVIIQTGLIDLYGLFVEFGLMRQVFDEMPERDLVAWNSLVAAYNRGNCPSKVIELLRQMVNENVALNGFTAVSVVSSFSALKNLHEGKAFHGYLIRKCVDQDAYVHNALIEMYSECGSLSSACNIYHLMPVKNVATWTCMINSFACNNYLNEALAVFREMKSENVRPDEITMLSVISVCAKLGRSELGEWVESFLEKGKFGIDSNTSLANALMNMHAKCGNMKRACEIFSGMRERTLISWTTLIQGLAMQGHGMAALIRFVQMQREGIKPDDIVFLGIISACSHAGMVEEGRKCFDSMMNDYGIIPSMEHYGNMVDLLCRAGLVHEAFKFVMKMPVEPDVILWRILLKACENQGCKNLAGEVIGRMVELRHKSCEDYVLMSNCSAAMADWEMVEELRQAMKAKKATKDPGCSFLEVNECVYH